MKSIIWLLFVFAAAMVSTTLNAQDAKRNLRNFEPKSKIEAFKVSGECGMCKRHIENTLKIDGIKSAGWDIDTKVLTVEYVLTADITGLDKIQRLVAAAGHDTEKYKAQDPVYNKLPGCCLYERIKAEKKVSNKIDLTKLIAFSLS